MQIGITGFVKSLSVILDYLENYFLGTSSYHTRRVAILANAMAKKLQLGEKTTYSLTVAAFLHDCALLEFQKEELAKEGQKPFEGNMQKHCQVGEDLVKRLPIYSGIEGAILYHHERADGKGAFGLTAAETPMVGQILHIVDLLDMTFDLHSMDQEKYAKLVAYVQAKKGTVFSEECAEAFLAAVDYDLLQSISGDKCLELMDELLEEKLIDISGATLKDIASIFAAVIDFKSQFTCRHSLGIAEKAEQFGRFYGYEEELCQQLYVAGALHDVGKIFVSNGILEKPGRLDADEYRAIQDHAVGTWLLLQDIQGLEEITHWAANHHEKLDGSGYPYKKQAEELDRYDRLLACLDIYQAMVEERPYKSGLSHGEAMQIIRRIGDAGQLDKEIIEEIEACFGPKDAQPETPKVEVEYWVCPVCGFIHEGKPPEGFVCPTCKQPGSVFKKMV